MVSRRLPTACRCTHTRSRQLGRTGLRVPTLCFGTMLSGQGTSYPHATRFLDRCMEGGINFFDTAEMYPVPQTADSQGLSERYLGQWMKHRARDKVIVATKVAGPSGQMTWIRGGPSKVDAANIAAAIDSSLQRLDTDYIDLYQVGFCWESLASHGYRTLFETLLTAGVPRVDVQIHWPDRYVPMFGDVDYDPSCAYTAVPLEEQLEALSKAVDAGKIRHVGLSNETAWGLMKCLHAAGSSAGLPRVASLQNAYSLTCRTFDSHLAECCHLEGVSLLAYSPLAMGLLTGKYHAPGGAPPEARLNLYKGRYAEAESRYGMRPNVYAAVAAYCELAREAGLTPTEMALRFVLSHTLVASAVVGATTMEQLEELIKAAESPFLDADLLEKIDKVHTQFPNPTP